MVMVFLHWVALFIWNDMKNIDLLLKCEHIDVNLIEQDDLDTTTPLILAVRQKSPNMVKKLLKHKNIKVNLKDESGYSPLGVAISQGDHEITDVLLKF